MNNEKRLSHCEGRFFIGGLVRSRCWLSLLFGTADPEDLNVQMGDPMEIATILPPEATKERHASGRFYRQEPSLLVQPLPRLLNMLWLKRFSLP